ncbi:hypothetical protein LCL99_19755 [Halomonas denitrificans]|uniref:lipopolysaccharide kinase InaA family protein n=1 Tax=Halomonas denitrificans TaxID=370769 RepID=UPI001CD48441|nr:lipopolysaccharide kinase InaA family protein [Halomonas denitrificans]MCA0976709.1 hypothetical protein [Halomonas denitrificans]
MQLLDIPFNDRRRRYLMFHTQGLPERLALSQTTTTEAFEAVGSSRFFVSEDGRILAKVVPDKFSKTLEPFKWLTRDYLEKRWLAQSDARKEYLSMRILDNAGLTTPRCHGWGVSLNPGNRNASLLLMERVDGAQPGEAVFAKSSEVERISLLESVAKEVLQLARAGFLHRDLHLNNLLVTQTQQLIWIDAHLRPIPKSKERRLGALLGTLTPSKLQGQHYRDWVAGYLTQRW